MNRHYLVIEKSTGALKVYVGNSMAEIEKDFDVKVISAFGENVTVN